MVSTQLVISKCIYCTEFFSEKNPKSKEHIIQKFLGGFWYEPISCAGCNSEFGDNIDAKWQQNHEVIRAMTELNIPLDPNVFKQTKKGPIDSDGKRKYELVSYKSIKTPFSVDRPNKTVMIDARFDDDKINASNALIGMMKKDYNISKEEASRFVQTTVGKFSKLQPGDSGKDEIIFGSKKIYLECAPHEESVKVDMQNHFPSTVSASQIVKVAYSFTAWFLEENIFQKEYEKFRSYLKVPNSGEKIRILQLETEWKNLEPIHIIAARVRNGKLYVVLILFHCIGFIVEMGPVSNVDDAQLMFNIKEKKIERCYFNDEEVFDEILKSF